MTSKVKNIQRTGYHLIPSSPFPLIAAVWTCFVVIRLIEILHAEEELECICDLLRAFIILFTVLRYWWRSVNIEASYLGYHTKITQKMIRFGILLFIVREVIFFFSFFWAFFHRSLAPSPYIGNVWPPVGIPLCSAWGWPLLGTIILLTSRGAVTYCHHEIRGRGLIPRPHFKEEFLKGIYQHFIFLRGKLEKEVTGSSSMLTEQPTGKIKALKILWISFLFKKFYNFLTYLSSLWNPYKTARLRLLATIIMGLIFLRLQQHEYFELGFNVNRSVYGSVFFFATGFHGLHVFVGVIFLYIQWKRIKHRHFSRKDHVGLEGAIWYWHFVDVVWLILYGRIYCWGNWKG